MCVSVCLCVCVCECVLESQKAPGSFLIPTHCLYSEIPFSLALVLRVSRVMYICVCVRLVLSLSIFLRWMCESCNTSEKPLRRALLVLTSHITYLNEYMNITQVSVTLCIFHLGIYKYHITLRVRDVTRMS